MHQFDEHHAEFKGFSKHFEREIRPQLSERDSVRQTAVKRGLIAIGVFIALGLAASAYIGLHVQPDSWVPLFVPLVLGPAIGFASFWGFTQAISQETKGRIVTAVTEFLGWQFDAKVSDFDMTPYRDHFLLTKRFDRSSFEDRLAGQAHGAAFDSVEAHLERRDRDSKGRTRWVTVFRGQLMRLDFPTKTFGRTVVLRDAGIFNKKKRGDMKRVGLSSPKFEKTFEAYGTDQVEARVILDPVFMQRMIDLEASVEGKRIRFAFVDNDLFIAVETGNRYEAGSMLQPLDAPERMQRILDEVGVIYDIVDGLVDRPAGRR
jgi:hypothetical protein